MNLLKLLLIIFSLGLFFCEIVHATELLSQIAPRYKPWLVIEGNSEQRAPFYVGPSARELALEFSEAQVPQLPLELKELASRQAKVVARKLKLKNGEFEIWPALNDAGRVTWVFARFRTDDSESWSWVSSFEWELTTITEPFLPLVLDPQTDRVAIFTDFLKQPSLYEKPVFGNCLWLKDGEITAAWLQPSEAPQFQKNLARKKDLKCVLLPQPSRFNHEAKTFVVKFNGDVVWNELARWTKPIERKPVSVDSLILNWPEDFKESYAQDVLEIAGEASITLPLSKKKLKLVRKSSAQANHQLEELVDYLEERYKVLGIKTRRQGFEWRGLPQSNLIAVIPGKIQGKKNRPVILADHIDTAFAEDVFDDTGKRVSVAGADDNVTATAGLLQAARVLKDLKPEHDIWLVHFTGEEFPAEDLGARYFVSELLRLKQDITAAVIMDMIGFRKKDDYVFQINPGFGTASHAVGEMAFAIATQISKPYKPAFRLRHDPRSYAYNTDVETISWAGFPSILLNEHINFEENLNRKHYHQSTDTTDRLDMDLATTVVRIATETVAQLALRRDNP